MLKLFAVARAVAAALVGAAPALARRARRHPHGDDVRERRHEAESQRPHGPRAVKEETMHKLTILAAVAAAALCAATAAQADAPVIFTESLTVTTPSQNISCRPYGYAFDTLATFTVDRHYVQFYDGSTLVKEIRHIDFTGTLYRSDDLSKTIPYAGIWTRTWDVAANTVTTTGLFRYSHPDGTGMVALDAGRTVSTGPPDFTLLQDTGPTQVEWQQAVCAYLAAQ